MPYRGHFGAVMRVRKSRKSRSFMRHANTRSTTQESLVGAPSCSRCRDEDCTALGGDVYSLWCGQCYRKVTETLGRRPS